MSKRMQMLDAMIAKGTADPFVFYARAMELRSMGDLEEALAAFGGVHERFPDYVPTFLMAGQVALEIGRRAEARAGFERGLAAAEAAGEDHALSELRAALDTL